MRSSQRAQRAEAAKLAAVNAEQPADAAAVGKPD
jgi:hypothetical protein